MISQGEAKLAVILAAARVDGAEVTVSARQFAILLDLAAYGETVLREIAAEGAGKSRARVAIAEIDRLVGTL